MNSKVTITILTFLILHVTSTQGASLRGKGGNLRCQCINPSTEFIHPKHMKEIDIIPSGPHCESVEIIVTLSSTNRVCLHPNAPWLQKIINKLTKSSKTHKAN